MHVATVGLKGRTSGSPTHSMGAAASHFSQATNRSPFQTVIVASSIGASGGICSSAEGLSSGSCATRV